MNEYGVLGNQNVSLSLFFAILNSQATATAMNFTSEH